MFINCIIRKYVESNRDSYIYIKRLWLIEKVGVISPIKNKASWLLSLAYLYGRAQTKRARKPREATARESFTKTEFWVLLAMQVAVPLRVVKLYLPVIVRTVELRHTWETVVVFLVAVPLK
jgi:hypothetical protein